MLKTPKFWLGRNSFDWLISMLLLPISALYFLGFWLKQKFSKTSKINLPVICIGNIIAGGAGKTPSALAIGKILHELEIEFCYLSRGYGGLATDLSGAKFFEKNSIGANDGCGDESIILNELSPIMIAKNRLLAAKKIKEMKRFQVVLMDDGLQNFSLFQDLKIVVVDGQIGFGNGLILPSGPLRQTINSGLKRSDLIFLVGEPDFKCLKTMENFTKYNKIAPPIIKINVIAKNIEQFANKKLLAFCGLAYPQKFFSFLANQGLLVEKTISFPDHYQFTESDLMHILKQAQISGMFAIATKKDWVKFPSKFQQQISYLDIDFEIEDRQLVVDLLRKFL